MRQHRDMTAVDGVGACLHPFRQKPVQFRLHGPVVVCHDVPARLRLPSDARPIPAEEIKSRGIMGRPHKLLLFLREVSREARDALRLHPQAPIPRFDVFEDIGGWYGACWLCDVSPASTSGARAAMYTSPTTRSSVPAAVITLPP